MDTPDTNELKLGSTNAIRVLVRQLKNPLLLMLVVATVVSYLFEERINAMVIMAMILLSLVLGFWNEYRAEKTMADLIKRITFAAIVIREGQKLSIPAKDVRLGDEVVLLPGTVVPADMKLNLSDHLEVNEAVLTGEALEVHKSRENRDVFMGTTVVSGSGQGKVIAIGRQTKFGQMSKSVATVRPETEFQKGLREFGGVLMRVIIVMAIFIFGVNALLGKSVLDSGMFALSVAIGLTPELLPVIVTVSLAHGAKKLAKKDVIVKQLVAIEDLGNMEVLCCDKTGTLTEGRVQLVSHQNLEGKEEEEILRMGLICNGAVVHHKLIGDGIDCAIWNHAREQGYKMEEIEEKIHQQPFDYEHRGMFTVVKEKGKRRFIFKGAPETVLNGCDLNSHKGHYQDQVKDWYKQGYRVVAVAQKTVTESERYTFGDAEQMSLKGFLLFSDPPKHGVRKALDRLEEMGVKLKIVTGDNEWVTMRVCQEIDVPYKNVITGPELNAMTDEVLASRVWETDIFARMTPDKKLRVVRALQYGRHTIGYMGDGINDAPALHEADAGICTNNSTDVAKDTATIVLMQKSLRVIAEGIAEGRRTFANTMKYILMGTSSNFGNMFSVAGVSFVLPFLPMLPKQILLTNIMYDFSQMAIPADEVDAEDLIKPQGWEVDKIKKYMFFYGPISSLYDFATYGIMYWVFSARNGLFQTGWFVESLITQILVVFVIRTSRTPFWKSRPSLALVLGCLGILAVAVVIPYLKVGKAIGFVPLPPGYFVVLLILAATYLGLVEVVKAKVLKR